MPLLHSDLVVRQSGLSWRHWKRAIAVIHSYAEVERRDLRRSRYAGVEQRVYEDGEIESERYWVLSRTKWPCEPISMRLTVLCRPAQMIEEPHLHFVSLRGFQIADCHGRYFRGQEKLRVRIQSPCRYRSVSEHPALQRSNTHRRTSPRLVLAICASRPSRPWSLLPERCGQDQRAEHGLRLALLWL